MSAVDNSDKKFKITVTNLCLRPFNKKIGPIDFIVEYCELGTQLRNIHKMGGKIIKITKIN